MTDTQEPSPLCTVTASVGRITPQGSHLSVLPFAETHLERSLLQGELLFANSSSKEKVARKGIFPVLSITTKLCSECDTTADTPKPQLAA